MSVKVKVCGITRREDAELALSLGTDYIGVNLYEKSPRCASMGQVAELLEVIPPEKRVVVDVVPTADKIAQCRDLGFQYFQIHFDLGIPMAAIAAWAKLIGTDNLWVAPRIPPNEPNFPQVLMEFSNTILVDTYSAKLYGGTGVSGENWQRFLDYSILYQHKAWILSGGLTPDNIEEAIAFTQAEFVDVASGVESEPGIKDPQKLKRFLKSAKA